MPTFRSSNLYPSGYSGNLVGTRTGSQVKKTLNPLTGRFEAPVRATAGNKFKYADELIDMIRQGQAQTKAEYDIPWNQYQSLLQTPQNSESRLQPAYNEWQKLLQNPGMGAGEANLLYGKQSDMVSNALQTALEQIARGMPAGIGATGEAQRGAYDTATGQKLQAQRDIDIEKLRSQREGKQTALTGMTSTAQSMATANQQDYASRMSVLDSIMQLAEMRNQADLTQKNEQAELLQAIIAGNVPSEVLTLLAQSMRGGGAKKGQSMSKLPMRNIRG